VLEEVGLQIQLEELEVWVGGVEVEGRGEEGLGVFL
jgi:hypothetical protein